MVLAHCSASLRRSTKTRNMRPERPRQRGSQRERREAAWLLGTQDRPVLLFVVENSPRPAYDAGQRLLVHVDRQTGLLLEHQVETTNERAAARHDDTAINDVARELRRSDFQRTTHRVDDLLNRF